MDDWHLLVFLTGNRDQGVGGQSVKPVTQSLVAVKLHALESMVGAGWGPARGPCVAHDPHFFFVQRQKNREKRCIVQNIRKKSFFFPSYNNKSTAYSNYAACRSAVCLICLREYDDINI